MRLLATTNFSELDSELREFTQPGQIIEELRSAKHPRHAALLKIWAPLASSKIEVERFSVSVQGYSYRHCIRGWGLMQFYLGTENENEIWPSHFGHLNQRGAEVRSADPSVSRNPGTAADWDWPLLLKISRRIQYSIRSRFSELKLRSQPALRDAARLYSSGCKLQP
jgi:hypothetical protein